MTSLVEEFKCAKTSQEISKDPVVQNAAPTVKTGKKSNPREAAHQAQGAL